MTRLIPWPFGVLAAVLGAGLFSTGCGENPGPTETPSAPGAAEALAIGIQALVFSQVSTGDMHTCGITTTGRAYCWGKNFQGQLGDGTDTTRLLPTPVAGGLVFRNVSAGQDHTCGVTTDFLAYCGGEPISGKLGIGSPVRRIVTTPTRVAGGLKFRVVAVGSAHSCGLTVPDDRAYCWGDNSLGQLGDGTTTERDTPVPVAGGRRFRQVTTGAIHTCAVTPSYQGYCWGWDAEGQLGDGATRQNRSRPSLVAGGHLFAQISAGFTNTCAVTTTARAFCWGRSPVGDGSTLSRFEPRAVSGNLSFTRVTAGDSHMCGETTGKKAYCWGTNSLGSLGNGVGGVGGIEPKPVAVSGGLLFAQLSAGRGTCGKTPEGAAYCWGENGDGQLGDGTTVSRFVPTLVANP
jgi:alpha-tubulin suppressor-like RCC1 family protein